MTVFSYICAAIFGVAAGVFWVLAIRFDGRASLFMWVCAAIGIIQCVGLAMGGTYTSFGTPGYTWTLIIVGLLLMILLCYLTYRARQYEMRGED